MPNHPTKDAQDYWDNALTWTGRIKVLRALELHNSLFKRDFADLPSIVQVRISLNVEDQAKQG